MTRLTFGEKNEPKTIKTQETSIRKQEHNVLFTHRKEKKSVVTVS